MKTSIDNVLFDVLVTDAKGLAVNGLKREDFSIFVDGKPTPILYFAPQDTAVAIAFLVDSSGSMRPLRNVTSMAAQRLFDLSRPGDEAMLIAFNDKPQMLIGPKPKATVQAGELQQALLREALWAGRTALYDSLLLGFQGLQQSTATRRATILFSDGGDNQSRAKKAEVQQALRSQSSTIYTVALIDPESKDLDEGFLRQAAAESGGRHYRITDPGQLDAVQRSIASDIRSRYVLGIAAKPFDGRPKHTIRVEAGKKLKTVHRTIYYSSEEAK